MLNRRLISSLIIKEGMVVQSLGFKRYLPVGKPSITVEFLNQWGIDEIVMLDIDRKTREVGPNFVRISEVSKKCFVPLTVGGGIQSIEQMRRVIQSGADKIAINHAALSRPNLIREASHIFGAQCVVVSMDIRRTKNGHYDVIDDWGTRSTGRDPVAWAKEVESMGAGEIFFNDADRDGFKQGYDIELISLISEAVRVPVIACGGVGSSSHLAQGFQKTSVSACAAGNFFHFTEHSPMIAKSFLRQQGIPLRCDTYADYSDTSFMEGERLAKRPEPYLEKLMYEYIPNEVI